MSERALSSPVPELWQQARAVWPEIDIELQAFADYLAERAEDTPKLDGERAADLYLACGCAAQLPAALSAFDAHYLSRVPLFLSRLSPSETVIADVKQILREKLFFGNSGAGKITEYSGQGALLSWVRVVALRAALSQLRKRSDRSLGELGGEDQVLGVGDDPEMAYLKSRYQSEFKEAFAAALARLNSEQRNLLRLHLIEGLSIDKLGGLFQVHRATAARWLQSAREELLTHTRDLLKQRLKLSPPEFDSLVRVLRSQLDLSVSRLLSEGSR
jgi:RNA polymerase sigma-70 factor (ECF subfamily)